MNINDAYIKEAPSAQLAIDIFTGEWSSALPSGFSLQTSPGSAGLFEDVRIAWAHEKLDFFGKQVLELGPLEGGHTYMLRRYGASRVVAIEANTRAYLKCLIVKEVLGLERVEFRLGDFNAYFERANEKFDVCVASGVLYHCVDPLRSLKHIANLSDEIFLWTHYYDQGIIENSVNLKPFFRDPEKISMDGNEYVACRKDYHAALEWQGFCGGTELYAYWLSRDAILQTLDRIGFKKVEVSFDQPDHPNGPAFAICGRRG